ncbi:MAG TPA: hypothetical protein VMG40_18555 [Bryobacteraceae bacterium]|nr:hypothetical protein [Bryobacteraceae bacterium]
MTVSVASFVTPEYDAFRLTDVRTLTDVVVTSNVAEVSPVGTVTLDGTLATLEFELTNDTVIPPAGAAALSVTLAATDPPPTTSVGLRLSPVSFADGFTVKDTVLLTLE